ncbi:unnamed protein product [Closterium sp. NIES-53]
MHAPRLRSLLCPSEGGANSCQQDPHSPSLPSPSCVSQVAPPPLVEPLEVSSGPTEGGDPAVGNTVASCLSPRLKTPPDFPPRPFSPPLQPVAVDSGAAGGGGARGADSRDAAAGVTKGLLRLGFLSLVLEVLVLEALEVLELEVQELEALELEVEELEVLELEALELEVLDLEVLELEALEVLEVLALAVLEVLVLEVLPLEVLEVLELEVLELAVLESLTERREPESCASSPATSPVRARASCARPHPVPSEDTMALRSSSVAQRLVQPSPPESSLSHVPDPESDLVHATSPIVTHVLTTLVIDHTFESAAASALVAELVDFAAAFHLDYFASLVSKSESDYPPSVGGELALGCDVIEDRQFELKCLVAAVPHLASMLLASEGVPDALDILTPRSYAELITSPYSSQWQTVMDAEMASWNSTSNYIDAIPPPRANIVNGMWIFRVKRPPGSPSVFKARYAARVFSQCLGVDFFQNFSPTPKIATIWVLLHVAEQCDNELHSLDFSTTFLQGSLHEEI